MGPLDAVSSDYAHAVRGVLLAELGEDLVGVYLYGSAATGAYVHGQSDVDMLVVVRDHQSPERVRSVLDGLHATPRPSAVRGLDVWIVPLHSTREPCAEPAFDCWLLTSIDRELIAGDGRPGDARLVLLYAMCRDHGIALAGPPPRRVFGRIARSWLVDAMRVDLALAGASGWYRVLNACRTLYFLEEGRMCGKLTGAAWARTKVADPSLIDAAVEWRHEGSGPPLPPEHVDGFVNAVAARLDGSSPAGAEKAAVPDVEPGPAITISGDGPLVTCVLVAPPSEELLVLAVKRYLEQDWPARELLVLRPPGAARPSAAVHHETIRTVPTTQQPADARELAVAHARGEFVASWDASTWYARDRLTQQVRELLSTSTPRLVAPSLVVSDPTRVAARRLREVDLLERATLCARRASWTAAGSPTRLGDRPDIAILVEAVDDELGEPVFPADVRLLVGEELDVYVAATATAAFQPTREPAVSCLMPTYNRRRFAERAIAFFLDQDYANRELVIVDDGQDAIDDLVPDGAPIRYHRLETRATIGRKRELACQLAEGELLVQWDDDDWYGPPRLRRQVAPLVAGTADIAGILRGYLLDLGTFRFWKGTPPLHEGDVHALIVAGTLAYTRDAWGETGGYPDRSIGEEVALLQAVLDAGGRVAPIVSDGIYVCVRHGANSWRLRFDAEQGPPGWAAVPPPQFFTPEDLSFYRSLSPAAVA